MPGPTPRDTDIDEPSSRGPLVDRSVVVCRPAVDAAALIDLLIEAGANPIHTPLQERGLPSDGGRALAAAFERLTDYRWLVVTSVNGVRAIGSHLPKVRPDRLRVAAVGPATARALTAVGYGPDLVPERSSAADLVDRFDIAEGPDAGTVLAPLAELASDELADGLEQKGYRVDRVEAYRMIETPLDPAQNRLVSDADTVIFTAPSAIDAFLRRFGQPTPSTVIACIGPRTAARARAQGLGEGGVGELIVAAEQSDRGVVDALVAAASGEICR